MIHKKQNNEMSTENINLSNVWSKLWRLSKLGQRPLPMSAILSSAVAYVLHVRGCNAVSVWVNVRFSMSVSSVCVKWTCTRFIASLFVCVANTSCGIRTVLDGGSIDDYCNFITIFCCSEVLLCFLIKNELRGCFDESFTFSIDWQELINNSFLGNSKKSLQIDTSTPKQDLNIK